MMESSSSESDEGDIKIVSKSLNTRSRLFTDDEDDTTATTTCNNQERLELNQKTPERQDVCIGTAIGTRSSERLKKKLQREYKPPSKKKILDSITGSNINYTDIRLPRRSTNKFIKG